MDWAEIISATARTGVGTTAIVYALAAIGLNVHFGYTGLLNFGQVGFMGAGAYGVAIAVDVWGFSLWAGIVFSVFTAVLLALLLGLPTLRLRASYLAIVTIAAGEIFRILIQNPNWRETTGGANGISGFSDAFYDINPIADGSYGFGPWHYSARSLWALLVGWGLVVVFALGVGILMRSPWGRVLKSVREDEDAARSLGKNAYGFKLQSLVVGGVIGAFAGMYQAIEKSSATPGNYRPETTFFVYAALILGGVARTWGPVLGAMLMVALLELVNGILRGAVTEELIPSSLMDTTQIGQVRLILVGVGLAALVVFRPQGLFGDKREIALEDR
ncbi:MAG TPA: branched-chain amino acid ABC transporter permease [Acidimicrobiales bacterium]|nr:branched-chain amino acid ABC transporter permease [Acidimicrobiales bacterium]